MTPSTPQNAVSPELEKVARVMRRHQITVDMANCGVAIPDSEEWWAGVVIDDEDLALARAALQALLPVSDETVEAMTAHDVPLDPRAVLQAAIDHILGEGQ